MKLRTALTRQLATKPFAVNFVLIADHRERLRVCLEEGVRLFSFFRGDPREHIATLPDGRAMPRYGFAFPRRGMQGDLAGMALYVGQAVGLLRDILPAAEFVGRLGSEAETVLARLGALAHPAQA
jgi:NAD(P)H-dependent flavin oxidoreductase YrpB (nitropropane dioxygenase family)